MLCKIWQEVSPFGSKRTSRCRSGQLGTVVSHMPWHIPCPLLGINKLQGVSHPDADEVRCNAEFFANIDFGAIAVNPTKIQVLPSVDSPLGFRVHRFALANLTQEKYVIHLWF
jgi:hypothetical protein